MLGGLVSCGPTHTAFTPLDVAKCNIQTDSTKYTGLLGSLKTIVDEEGLGGVWKGWLPTLLGYSAQGVFKFGLYEVFKDLYGALAGEEAAFLYRGAVFLLAAASAEFFADIALCPMEMVKVKVQTASRRTFPTDFESALSAMWDSRQSTGFPFGSLVPLWSRQIPYTMTKFYFFEKIVEVLYATVLTEPRASYGTGPQLAVTFAAGYLAGVICAVVSNPADTVVSKMGIEGSSPGQIFSQLGLKGAFSGLGTRMLVVGTLTGLQWWIYDTFKTVLGMGTTGG
ncbi:unnamed protein product [Sphacelaria rigidula]